MTKRKSSKTDLRKRAEAKLPRRPARKQGQRGGLAHELEVHKVELEMQNDELRNTQRLAEDALARYTEIFDFAPIGYAVLDDKAAIIDVNHAGASLLRRERGRCINARFAAFVDAPELHKIDRVLAHTIASGKAESCEVTLSGEGQIAVRVTAAALRRDQITFIVAFEDISARKLKESELARSQEALRELNRRKDDFFAMLSHELRNPLSPIRTSVAVLQLAPAGSDAARSAVGIIDRSAAHLTRLVDDLLDVTRITRGKIDLHREPVELIELVNRTVDDHHDSLAHRRITLETRFAFDTLWIEGDRVRLVQVLSNVLANAEKFTPAGGRVIIDVTQTDGMAIICVRDTGVGMTPEVLDRVFEPFSQGPQPIARERGGLGLGLAMVKSLVELHGGNVVIRSDGPGKGTEVEISVPMHGVALRERTDDATIASQHTHRVLIVEDMVDNAFSLQQALTFLGHDARVAHTGRAGLELALSFRPDVVLCDLGLPDIDGFAVAQRMRADRRLSDVYLVALSGYALAQDISRAKAAGFDQHLAKPVSLEQIQRVLLTAERRSRSTENILHS